MFFSMMPVLLFMFAVSIDSLTAGFSYGTSRVHIKPLAALFLVFIPTAAITLMTRIGSLLFSFIPAPVFSILSFVLLFILGCEKLIESLIRHLAGKYPNNVGTPVIVHELLVAVYYGAGKKEPKEETKEAYIVQAAEETGR